MRTLHLVRHGETLWNAEHRLQGREDIPLSAVGEHQARTLRGLLSAVMGHPTTDTTADVAVVVSPLARARRTCELLGLTPTVVDQRWQEADLGEWTGRTRAQLLASQPPSAGNGSGPGEYAAWRAGTFSPPGAEPQPDLAARVASALADLPDAEQVVVVTHGGPIRAVCRQLLGLEPARLVPVQPGSLTVIDVAGDGPRLEYFNLTPVAAHVLSAEPSD